MAAWYQDNLRLTNFGQVLIAAGVLEDTTDMRRYFKEPYKYDELYKAWKDAGYPQEEDEEWDDFIAAVDTDDTSTEDVVEEETSDEASDDDE